MKRRKKRRAAAASFGDDAAGVGRASDKVVEVYAVRAFGSDMASGSDDEHSNGPGIGLDSQASSEGDLRSEDAYSEEDWAELEQAEAGAANTDAVSDDRHLEQEPEMCTDRLQQDVDASQQAVSPRQGCRTARPDQEHTASGHAPADAPPTSGERRHVLPLSLIYAPSELARPLRYDEESFKASCTRTAGMQAWRHQGHRGAA